MRMAALPLAVEGPWLVPGRPTLALAAGLENATLTLKGVNSLGNGRTNVDIRGARSFAQCVSLVILLMP